MRWITSGLERLKYPAAIVSRSRRRVDSKKLGLNLKTDEAIQTLPIAPVIFPSFCTKELTNNAL
jgi:hypothetical protein